MKILILFIYLFNLKRRKNYSQKREASKTESHSSASSMNSSHVYIIIYAYIVKFIGQLYYTIIMIFLLYSYLFIEKIVISNFRASVTVVITATATSNIWFASIIQKKTTQLASFSEVDLDMGKVT